jgi:hypothetical protein
MNTPFDTWNTLQDFTKIFLWSNSNKAHFPKGLLGCLIPPDCQKVLYSATEKHNLVKTFNP